MIARIDIFLRNLEEPAGKNIAGEQHKRDKGRKHHRYKAFFQTAFFGKDLRTGKEHPQKAEQNIHGIQQLIEHKGREPRTGKLLAVDKKGSGFHHAQSDGQPNHAIIQLVRQKADAEHFASVVQ